MIGNALNDFFLNQSFHRAPGELDGHARDPVGRHGVPAEVSWRHAGRAAERRGAVSRRSQKDCCHGEIPMETPDLAKCPKRTALRLRVQIKIKCQN